MAEMETMRVELDFAIDVDENAMTVLRKQSTSADGREGTRYYLSEDAYIDVFRAPDKTLIRCVNAKSQLEVSRAKVSFRPL